MQPVPVDAEGIVTDALPAAAPQLICVTPSHQFPSGVVMSLPRRLALLDYAERHQCWILEDDYDGEFRYDQKPLSALRAMDESDRVIHVGTFSKLLFPSLRLGYLVMPRSLRNDFRTAKWANDLGTSAIEQAALAHFMTEGGFERHLRRASRELQERRNALLQGLDACSDGRLEIADSHAGMHLVAWMKGATMADGERFLQDARRVGLGLHPIHPHYMEPPDSFGLLLGFCGLSTAQIREAMPLFHQCLDRARQPPP
jgi:GntR family transcriptional regulator/MocR family aminotransferase